MRIHRILAEAAAALLKATFREHQVLDKLVAEAFLEHPKWGSRDRNFVAETVFEVTRWRRALAFLGDSDDFASLCATQWMRMGYEIPAWWSHTALPMEEQAAREVALAEQPRAVRESIPDWLDALGEAELGPAWDAELAALNERAPVYLRANTLCGSRDQIAEWLRDMGVESAPVNGVPDALVLPPGKVLPKNLRQDGRVEIQDAGSQRIAPLLHAQPGQRIIDACSGAGGKTLHLAALMNNEGKIYAMDIEPKKLRELERRAKRARAGCIVTKPVTETMSQDFAGVADGLLIDAPCSGLGTLRRQPDLKWHLRPAKLEQVREIQRGLLARYPEMLKPGGTLVYATCSILPSENRAAIEPLLTENGGFELIEELQVSPARDRSDGFYAAALRKS